MLFKRRRRTYFPGKNNARNDISSMFLSFHHIIQIFECVNTVKFSATQKNKPDECRYRRQKSPSPNVPGKISSSRLAKSPVPDFPGLLLSSSIISCGLSHNTSSFLFWHMGIVSSLLISLIQKNRY